MRSGRRLRILKGGWRINTLIQQLKAKASYKKKSDWDELAEECQAFVKEKGLTEKDLYETQILVRKLLNGGNSS